MSSEESAITEARHKAQVVLVVEDEPLLRLDIVDSLEEAGFAVLEAWNAAEAIRILEARSDVALVFTDVDMPGSIDGLKLARYVRDRWPPIKLVVTSGHVPVKERDLPSGGRFLAKPYDASQVIRTMRELVRN